MLGTFLSLPNGIPSEATLRRVLSVLDPENIEKVYREWITPYIGTCMNKQVCIDGKTVCGVSKGSGEISNLHIVSAWVKEDGVCFGQVRTQEKSNEITAIHLLLDSLDVRGATVTIDAMGCQKKIAAKIIGREANYVLAVKGNQPTLTTEIKEYFDWACGDEVESRTLEIYHEDERSRDRRVERTTTVSTDVSWFEDRKEWNQLHAFIRVAQRTTTAKGVSKEKRLYISSLDTGAMAFANYTRNHWSIENNLHWMLDTTFHEDASLIHMGHAPENFSVLRKVSVALLKRAGSPKVNVRRKRKIASYDDAFLRSVLSMPK